MEVSSEDDLSPESDSEAMEVDLMPQGVISHCVYSHLPIVYSLAVICVNPQSLTLQSAVLPWQAAAGTWLVSVPDPKLTYPSTDHYQCCTLGIRMRRVSLAQKNIRKYASRYPL